VLDSTVSSPADILIGTQIRSSDLLATVDEGDVGTERDRFDDLHFGDPIEHPGLLVQINRSNGVEAEAIQALIREYSDVFAVEVRTKPARVPPIQRKMDVAEWQELVSRTGPDPSTSRSSRR
jgi:hypothetical protein